MPRRTKYETKYKTITKEHCPYKRARDITLEAFAEIDKRDPEAYPLLPDILSKWGSNKISKACYCLPKPEEKPVVTKTETKYVVSLDPLSHMHDNFRGSHLADQVRDQV